MKNVNVKELDVVSVEFLEKNFDKEIINDIRGMLGSDDIVIEIMVGSRGIVEEVKKVDVVDGMFKVNDVDDIEKVIFEDIDEDDFDSIEEMNVEKDFMRDFVYSDIDEIDNKKLYLEGWFEESYSYYVRVI